MASNMTGAALRAARKAAGLSQIELAKRAGVGRHAVQYHEARDRIDLLGWAIGRIRTVLGVDAVPDYSGINGARAAWAETLLEAERRTLEARMAAWAERVAQRRIRCNAKTRKGTACRNKSEPGKTRCKFHGGKSTGAKTPEGKARIAEAQKRRWAKWRETKP